MQPCKVGDKVLWDSEGIRVWERELLTPDVSWLWGPPGLASIIHSVALNPPEYRQPLSHSSFFQLT